MKSNKTLISFITDNLFVNRPTYCNYNTWHSHKFPRIAAGFRHTRDMARLRTRTLFQLFIYDYKADYIVLHSFQECCGVEHLWDGYYFIPEGELIRGPGQIVDLDTFCFISLVIMHPHYLSL